MKAIKESILLILSYLILYFWKQSSFFIYTVPVIGFFIFLLLLISAKRKGKNLLSLSQKTTSLHIIVINTILLLFVFLTNGINSPLFFLLYFLSFGITFVLQPTTVFVFTIATLLLFAEDVLKDMSLPTIIKMGSLLLISPLAFYFGKEFRQDEKDEKK